MNNIIYHLEMIFLFSIFIIPLLYILFGDSTRSNEQRIIFYKAVPSRFNPGTIINYIYKNNYNQYYVSHWDHRNSDGEVNIYDFFYHCDKPDWKSKEEIEEDLGEKL